MPKLASGLVLVKFVSKSVVYHKSSYEKVWTYNKSSYEKV